MQKIPAVMIEGGVGGYVYLTEKFKSTQNLQNSIMSSTPPINTTETKYIELPAGSYYAILEYYTSSHGNTPSSLKYELKNGATSVTSAIVNTQSDDFTAEVPSSAYSLFTLNARTKLTLILTLLDSNNYHNHAIFKIFPQTFTNS